jgi:hypothetical protein
MTVSLTMEVTVMRKDWGKHNKRNMQDSIRGADVTRGFRCDGLKVIEDQEGREIRTHFIASPLRRIPRSILHVRDALAHVALSAADLRHIPSISSGGWVMNERMVTTPPAYFAASSKRPDITLNRSG